MDALQRERRPVALITGAGGGIGRELAIGLAAAGFNICAQGRTLNRVSATADAVAGVGGRAVAIIGDVAQPDAARRAIEMAVESFGSLDLLVNNAAQMDPREEAVWDTDVNEWWDVVTTNLRGPMLTCSCAVPLMVTKGSGRIVNVGTLAVARTHPFYSAYAASKAGLMKLSEALSVQLQGTGVAVFDVSPGLVRSRMSLGMPMWAGIPDEDWTPASEVVSLVLRLARGDGDALSGRFLRASDDLDALVRSAALWGPGGRRLRIERYSADDPLPD